jgi:hypothetical protein
LNLFDGFSFGINLWLKRDELDEVAIANRKDFLGVVGVTTPRRQEKLLYLFSLYQSNRHRQCRQWSNRRFASSVSGAGALSEGTTVLTSPKRVDVYGVLRKKL